MAQVFASQAARAVPKQAKMSSLFGYFGTALVGVSAVTAYRLTDDRSTHKGGGIKAYREARKLGYPEMYKSRGHSDAAITAARGEMPERFHHMRTGQLTLQRKDSRNPNVLQQENRKLARKRTREAKRAQAEAEARQQPEQLAVMELID